MGCYEVSLGDTLGIGAPSDVEALLSILLENISPGKLAGHFHDTYGQALANVMKAYSMGLRTFDSSVAGLGGCPYAKGARGNLATEDIVYAFERHGVPTGVNLAELAATGEWISDVLKQPNGSRAGAALAARFKEDNAPGPTKEIKLASAPLEKSGWKTFQKSKRLTVARKGRSVLVKLTRPRHANMLTVPLVRELTDTIKSLSSQSSTISRIAITGEGRYFCSGMDLRSRARPYGLVGLFDAISQAPQVTVALVNGPCFGGGVGLAFACDVRLASSAANFTLSEAQLAFAPVFTSKYVVREWGPAFAGAAMEAAKTVSAEELYRIGAVHEVYDDDGASDEQATTVLDDFLERLHACTPQDCQHCKKLAQVAWEDPGGSNASRSPQSLLPNQ